MSIAFKFNSTLKFFVILNPALKKTSSFVLSFSMNKVHIYIESKKVYQLSVSSNFMGGSIRKKKYLKRLCGKGKEAIMQKKND